MTDLHTAGTGTPATGTDGPGPGPADDSAPVLERLSTLDRFLPVWIGVAMVAGLLFGRVIPGLADALDTVKIGQTSLPIALGLLLMMYPVLAKVRYDEAAHITADRRMMAASLTFNWVHRPGADVHPGLAAAGRPARLPHRGHPGRAGPLHRHGADLERPGPRRPGDGRRPRRPQRHLPGALLRRPRLLLPAAAARLARPADHRPGRVHGRDRRHRRDLPRHPAGGRLPVPPGSANAPAAGTGTRAGSCPGSRRWPSTGCCSPSSSCSPCRARPSPASRSTWCGSRCRCWPTSPSCGPPALLPAGGCG